MPPALPAHRLNNFDAVRMVAALTVLVSHQFSLTGHGEAGLFEVHSWGGVAVLVFFSISGFLVAQSWDNDPRLHAFMARRLLRVWPALAVAVVLTACVLGPLIGSMPWRDYVHDPLFRRYFKILRFSNQLFLPTGFEGNVLGRVINGSLWTIPIEMKCYVALAVVGALGLLRPRWRPLLAVLLVAVAAGYLWPAPWRYGWIVRRDMPLEFMLCFAFGMLCHYHRPRTTGPGAWPLLAAAWAAGAVAYAAHQQVLALVLWVPLTAVWAGTSSWPVVRRLGRFGDVSYGLYIYAFPTQQLMIWLYKDRLPWGAVLLLAIAGTMALAFASWHGVEKHALRWKPRTPRRAAAEKAPALA